MELSDAADFLSSSTRGVFVTMRRNGLPQLSNVVYTFADGVVRVSVTDDRAKTRNADRDPRTVLHVTSADFWAYVVAEGSSSVSGVATSPDDAVCDELCDVYEAISGQTHPDWSEFRQAMVAERRRVITMTVDRVYGQLPG